MWLKIRKDFTHLNELCATLNKALGNLTFLILVNHSSVLLYYFYIAITYKQKKNQVRSIPITSKFSELRKKTVTFGKSCIAIIAYHLR